MRPIFNVFFLSVVLLLFSFSSLVSGQSNSGFYLKGLKILDGIIKDDFLVNDDTTCGCYHDDPVIAQDPSGNFVIAWEDQRNESLLDRDIYAQRYNSSGIPLGSNFRVNDDTGDASQECPCDVAMDDSGNFLVIFEDHRTPDSKDYAQWYDSNGNPIGSNFPINYNSDTACVDRRAVIGMNSSGKYVFVWTDGRGTPWPNSDIYIQRYEYPHTPIGDNLKVNDDVDSAFQDDAAIAMDISGNFVITWEDGRNYGYPYLDIYGQRYNSSGTPLGPNFNVNDYIGTVYYGGHPVIAMDGYGNFVITWNDYRNGNYDIYCQRFNSSGIPLGPNFKVNDDTGTAEQVYPAITMDASGKFVIIWEDDRNGNPDIYTQRYSADGNPVGGNYLVPNPQYSSFEQLEPEVAANSSNIYFTWQDNRRGKGWDIYAKVVDWQWTKVGEDEIVGLPNSFELLQNYPNPFNPTTKIQFRVGSLGFGRPVHATLNIYNILGQLVKTLVDEEKLPGNYNIIWDGKDDSGKEVGSGIYFYQLKTKDYTATKKMVLLR